MFHAGLKFWKVPSRKIYAVQVTELTSKGKGVSVVISSEDSENDKEGSFQY